MRGRERAWAAGASAATDEFNNFQVGAVGDPSVRPIPFANNRPIEFHGHPVQGQREKCQKGINRLAGRNFAGLAIDEDGYHFSTVGRVSRLAQL